MATGNDLTTTLTESQELAKEIQRQDKAKLLPGELNVIKLCFYVAKKLLYNGDSKFYRSNPNAIQKRNILMFWFWMIPILNIQNYSYS